MARKALVRTSDGLVVNVILLEEGADWSPLPGHEVVDALDAGLGDTWDGQAFLKPIPPAPVPVPEPPIIGVMDGVLKGRGLAGLTAKERENARSALG